MENIDTDVRVYRGLGFQIMRNDQILSGINEKSESTSGTPVYSMSDPLFWQQPALSV